MSDHLTWSHYVELIWLKDINKIYYYVNVSINNHLSIRKLRERIKSNEYERLPKEDFINNSDSFVHEISKQLKYPILIKNTGGYDKITEKVLQKLILEDIDRFLKELGEGFCYIKNEYPIKLGNNYNYIDLLLFHYKYNCFVVVELKAVELKK